MIRCLPGLRAVKRFLLALVLVVVAQASLCKADLIAGGYSFGAVHRFDEITGAVVAPDISVGTMNSVAGVAVGPDGNIYVASQGTGEILFFDGTTGAPLTSPQPGGSLGLFASLVTPATPGSTPGPIRFTPDGTKLYVSDFGGSKIRVFDTATGAELPPAAEGFAPPGGITFGPDGAFYAGNFGTASVIRFHNGQIDPIITSGTSPLQTPSSLLFLPNGNLLVVDLFGNKILRYAASGSYVGVFAEIEPTDPDPAYSNFPSDIAYDADGNLVVAVLGHTNPPDNRGQILRFDLNGNQLGEPIVDAHPPLSSITWIRSVNAIDGDFNSDGQITAADYDKWTADFGKWVAKGGGADGNGNGIVDAGDYTVWRDAFTAAGGAAISFTVPEPPTAALAVFAAIFLFSASTHQNRTSRVHIPAATGVARAV
jgi:sugar lactone lactonase YvrE